MAFFQADTLSIQEQTEGVATLVLDVPHRPVNVCSRQFMTDLDAALERLEAAGAFRALVIRSAKSGNFLAGADVLELARIQSAEEAVELSARGQRVFDRLADLKLPTVAVVAGACLGGGLELCLACDHRVVVEDAKTQLGFPEVELGLIPGWGGTQRLPCAVGLENALQMILGARRLSAQQALRWGLADGIVAADKPGLPDCVGEPRKRPLRTLPLRTWRQRMLEGTRPGRWLVFRGADRVLRKRLPDDMPAPYSALSAIRTGLQEGRDAGLAQERAAIGRLATSNACRNLVELFLRREQAKQAMPRQPVDAAQAIRRIGVVGAGVMGAGIAELAVLKGCEVVIREADETALGFGLFRLMGLLNHAVERGLLPPSELKARLAAIHGTAAWSGFADVDLVVEAIPEDLPAKRELFRDLERHTSPSTILVTNTSSLRVADLAQDLQYPGRVAGLHFFNPVHKMPLVEVAQTPKTRPEVLQRLRQWTHHLGKIPIDVKDSPGFVVNRVLMPYLNEAVLLASEGMRFPLIDEAMRRFGMPIGPLQLLDQIGLDVAAGVAEALAPVFCVSPVFAQMNQQGWLGQKSGLGFYRYRRGREKVHEGARLLVLEAVVPTTGTPAEEMAAARERMVGLMVNEAARCLEEAIVLSDSGADLLDLAMVLGAGWAPHRGGPMRYAAQRGFESVVASLTALAGQLGPRFEPCAELRRRAASHK